MNLKRCTTEQNFPELEPGEAAGAIQGWIMENLVNHFREFLYLLGSLGEPLKGPTVRNDMDSFATWTEKPVQ